MAFWGVEICQECFWVGPGHQWFCVTDALLSFCMWCSGSGLLFSPHFCLCSLQVAEFRCLICREIYLCVCIHICVWFSSEDLRSCVSWLLEPLWSLVNIRLRGSSSWVSKNISSVRSCVQNYAWRAQCKFMCSSCSNSRGFKHMKSWFHRGVREGSRHQQLDQVWNISALQDPGPGHYSITGRRKRTV